MKGRAEVIDEMEAMLPASALHNINRRLLRPYLHFLTPCNSSDSEGNSSKKTDASAVERMEERLQWCEVLLKDLHSKHEDQAAQQKIMWQEMKQQLLLVAKQLQAVEGVIANSMSSKGQQEQQQQTEVEPQEALLADGCIQHQLYGQQPQDKEQQEAEQHQQQEEGQRQSAVQSRLSLGMGQSGQSMGDSMMTDMQQGQLPAL